MKKNGSPIFANLAPVSKKGQKLDLKAHFKKWAFPAFLSPCPATSRWGPCPSAEEFFVGPFCKN